MRRRTRNILYPRHTEPTIRKRQGYGNSKDDLLTDSATHLWHLTHQDENNNQPGLHQDII